MDGLIVVNKPAGITSHDVVNKIRRIFNTKQVGHLGTLDPLATGVLVVALNKATKLVPYLENVTKEYVVEATIGLESDTFDSLGVITKSVKPTNITEEIIDKTLESFLGVSEQTPPIYSAIKVKGKKLYEYARNNKEVEIPKRTIEIFEIKRTTPLIEDGDTIKFSFKVVVSKGTYIRSLVYDFGQKLGVPALMSALERTRNGVFSISSSSTISDIEEGNYQIISMLDALSDYKVIDNDECYQKAKNGMKISPKVVKEILNDMPSLIVIKHEDKLIGIYQLDKEINGYVAGRIWNY